jgi:glyoxylase-like metal-dependent hydrolase (beta-lactamase superfamily II)
MKLFLKILAALIVLFIGAAWWLLMDASAPLKANSEFDLTVFRELVAQGDPSTFPAELRIETLGTDEVPSFAAEAGWFTDDVRMAYTALQLVYRGTNKQTLIIGGAINQSYSDKSAQSAAATFDSKAYDRLVSALSSADQIWITHEHPDHVMAITHHPDPASIAAQLKLNQQQLNTLPIFAADEVLDPALSNIAPTPVGMPIRIAPGVVAFPSPGHSPGSVSFFVKLNNGREYLLIGDIVWMMHNIKSLKSRPRLLNLAFGLGEDRAMVQQQVRALHDLQLAEPELIIVPSHDAIYLDQLVRDNHLIQGFW